MTPEQQALLERIALAFERVAQALEANNGAARIEQVAGMTSPVELREMADLIEANG